MWLCLCPFGVGGLGWCWVQAGIVEQWAGHAEVGCARVAVQWGVVVAAGHWGV